MSLLLLCLFFSPQQIEENLEPYYVPVNQIADSVRIDMHGVLSFNHYVNDSEGQPAALIVYRVPKVIEGHKHLLKDATFISGWSSSGLFYKRFPIISRQGDDFVQIVLDPIRDTRGWVRLSELPDSIPDEFKKDVVLMDIFTTWFIEDREAGDEDSGLAVDVFTLADGGKLQLHSRPDVEDLNVTAVRATDIRPGSTNEVDPIPVSYGSEYYFIREFRNGFGRLEFFNFQKQANEIYWIPIRDNRGRFQIWPTTVPGC